MDPGSTLGQQWEPTQTNPGITLCQVCSLQLHSLLLSLTLSLFPPTFLFLQKLFPIGQSKNGPPAALTKATRFLCILQILFYLHGEKKAIIWNPHTTLTLTVETQHKNVAVEHDGENTRLQDIQLWRTGMQRHVCHNLGLENLFQHSSTILICSEIFFSLKSTHLKWLLLGSIYQRTC